MVQDLGERIRYVRKRRSLTLKQLSELTGLSVGFLSEIERGLSDPSMASLRRIRRALGVSLISFPDNENHSSEADDLIPLTGEPAIGVRKTITQAKMVPAGERKKLAYPNQPGFYELLTPDLNRQLEVLYFKFEGGFDTGPDPIIDPPGEKCMIILKGRLLFRVDEEIFDLREGDSLSYPAQSPVTWVAPGKEPTEGILIVTPPGF